MNFFIIVLLKACESSVIEHIEQLSKTYDTLGVALQLASNHIRAARSLKEKCAQMECLEREHELLQKTAGFYLIMDDTSTFILFCTYELIQYYSSFVL